MRVIQRRSAVLTVVSAFLSATALPVLAPVAAYATEQVAVQTVHCRMVKIAGVDSFYREADPGDAPVLLLLHGFPTSSHMLPNLMPALADRYHVIAPANVSFCERKTQHGLD